MKQDVDITPQEFPTLSPAREEIYARFGLQGGPLLLSQVRETLDLTDKGSELAVLLSFQTANEIMATLGIAHSTVSSRCRRLYQKANVRNKFELAFQIGVLWMFVRSLHNL